MLEKGRIDLNVRALFQGWIYLTPSRTPSGLDEAPGFHSGDGYGTARGRRLSPHLGGRLP